MNEMSINEQIQMLNEKAKSLGTSEGFCFKATMSNYVAQMNIAQELKQKAMAGDRKALADYNRTVTSLNGTAKTLLAILGGNGSNEEVKAVRLIEDKPRDN